MLFNVEIELDAENRSPQSSLQAGCPASGDTLQASPPPLLGGGTKTLVLEAGGPASEGHPAGAARLSAGSKYLKLPQGSLNYIKIT